MTCTELVDLSSDDFFGCVQTGLWLTLRVCLLCVLHLNSRYDRDAYHDTGIGLKTLSIFLQGTTTLAN